MKTEGTFSAIKAFIFRFYNCQKGYKIKTDGDNILFYSVKNINIKIKDIHPSIIKTFVDSNNFNKKLKSATEVSKKNSI